MQPMPLQRRKTPRLRAGILAALLVLALVPLTSALTRSPGRTSTASGGAVGRPLAERSPGDVAPRRTAVRKQIVERAQGTYISEMLALRDSALARWPDRRGIPLVVWVQADPRIDGFAPSHAAEVRRAFQQWNKLKLPIAFTFTEDSAAADVHVTFVDHFDEEISGRTKWARDDHWWITDADIVLAVHHRDGLMLDEDAMHAMSLHEIGHLLGLDHTRDSTSIMAPKVRVRSLSRADRATVRLLYTLPPGGVR